MKIYNKISDKIFPKIFSKFSRFQNADSLPRGYIARWNSSGVDTIGLSIKTRPFANTPDFYVDNTHTGTNSGTLANPFQSFTALFAAAGLTPFAEKTIFIAATSKPYRVTDAGHFKNDKCFGNFFYFDWDGVTATGRITDRAQVWGSENASAKTGDWVKVGETNVYYHDNITSIDVGEANARSIWWVREWPDDVVVLSGRSPYNDTDIDQLPANRYFYSGGRLYINIGADPTGELIEYSSTAIPTADDQVFEVYTGQEIYRGKFRFGGIIQKNGHCSGWVIAGCDMSYAGGIGFNSGADTKYCSDYYNPDCSGGSCTFSGIDGASGYAAITPAYMRNRKALLVGNTITCVGGLANNGFGIVFDKTGGTTVVGGRDVIVAFNIFAHIAGVGIISTTGSFTENTKTDIYNNVFLGWGSSLGAIYNQGGAANICRMKIRNNIFINPGSTNKAIYSSDHANAQFDSDYNRFYALNNGWNSGNIIGTATTNHTDAAYDEGVHSTAGNPLFTDISEFTALFAGGVPPAYDLSLQSDSPLIGTGANSFVDGDDNQFDLNGAMVWSDTTNLPDGPFLDGVDIGAFAYVVGGKYFLSLLGPDGAKYWPSAPELIAITGVDNAVFDAAGVGKTFATEALVLAALATVEDNIKLFVGGKGAVLYDTDMSAELAKIQRAGY